GAARAVPLDGPAAHVRRTFRRLPPTGTGRDLRNLLEPRGDAGGRVSRAGGRRLDLSVLPRVGDRLAARHAARDRAVVVARSFLRLVEPRGPQGRVDLRPDR